MESKSRYFNNPFGSEGRVEISPELFKTRTLSCVDHILKHLPATYNHCDGGMFL